MILDFRKHGGGTQFEADLCIVGAGAAGIALAREFVGTSVQVCLIESGGLAAAADTQALTEGEIAGRAYPLSASRLRFFGGSTNHWVGQCWPLGEIDFRERPWVPHSGWPIERATLDPYYERAQILCRLGPYVYDDRLWQHVPVSPPGFRESQLSTHFWQQPAPTRFGIVYRKQLSRAANVKVLMNANVTSIETNESGSTATHVELRTLEGRRGRVVARRFVLACGGIENPRILLLSNRHQRAGVGNQRDLVGRYFMDHPHVPCGLVRAESGSDLKRAFCDPSFIPPPAVGRPKTPFFLSISASPALQEQERILNTGIRLVALSDLERL